MTNTAEADNSLSMAGTIRTKEKCPKCKGKFQGVPLECPTCLNSPKKYYIDLHYKGHGRIRIFCDRQGQPLDSWRRAMRLIETIRYEIDQHIFDPSKYVRVDLATFLFETRAKAWYQANLMEAEKGNMSVQHAKMCESTNQIYFLPYFKGMDVREIRTYHVKEFYSGLSSKLALSTIKAILNKLKTFFHVLYREEYIPSQPQFPKIKLHKKIPQWLDEKTQIEIMNKIPEEHRPVFFFLAFQGVRPGEARGLKVKDFNFKEHCFTVSRTLSYNKLIERVKGKVEKRRFINPDLMEMLQKQCKDKVPEAFVFTSHHGKPYTHTYMGNIWRKVRGDLDLTLYEATRHSWASNALRRGVPVSAIRDVLGHVDIQTTMIYAHSGFDNQKAAFSSSNEDNVRSLFQNKEESK